MYVWKTSLFFLKNNNSLLYHIEMRPVNSCHNIFLGILDFVNYLLEWVIELMCIFGRIDTILIKLLPAVAMATDSVFLVLPVCCVSCSSPTQWGIVWSRYVSDITCLWLNSLASGRCGSNLKSIILKLLVKNKSLGTHCKIAPINECHNTSLMRW